MTRDEFLADTWRFLSGSSEFYSIQPEWVSEAWDRDQQFRTELVESFVRTLDKVGSFCNPEGLTFIRRALTPTQSVDFFIHLRETTRRPELEWRAEFEDAFSAIASELPPPTPCELERYNFANALVFAIEDKDLWKVKLLLRYMAHQGVPLTSVRILDEESLGLTVEQLQEMDAEEFERLIQSPPPGAKWLSAIEYAEFVGALEIVHVLKSAE